MDYKHTWLSLLNFKQQPTLAGALILCIRQALACNSTYITIFGYLTFRKRVCSFWTSNQQYYDPRSCSIILVLFVKLSHKVKFTPLINRTCKQTMFCRMFAVFPNRRFITKLHFGPHCIYYCLKSKQLLSCQIVQ